MDGSELQKPKEGEQPIPRFSQLIQHMAIDLKRPEPPSASASGPDEPGTNLHREPGMISVSHLSMLEVNVLRFLGSSARRASFRELRWKGCSDVPKDVGRARPPPSLA